jgi:hypothetical protein
VIELLPSKYKVNPSTEKKKKIYIYIYRERERENSPTKIVKIIRIMQSVSC